MADKGPEAGDEGITAYDYRAKYELHVELLNIQILI